MDIRLSPKNGCFDLLIAGQDFESDKGLETAVVISLYTNRRVSEEQLPELIEDKQGWWGDMIAEIEGDQIGSRLWTLERRKQTTETLRLFEDYVREALDWMIEDGIAKQINIAASYIDSKLVGALSIVKPDGREFRFSILWDEQILRVG